jgi:very-short-patch-repair endonuclease
MDAYLVEGTLDKRIAALADRYHGVVDVDQLRSVGATRTQIGKRVRSRRLVPLYRGVYAVGHRQLTNSGRWLAAVRALGAGAVLSHLQAAVLWSLRPARAGWIHVTVPKGGRAKRRGLIVHRTVELPSEHVTVHKAIPVTTPARTLADLAGMLDTPALARALEEAEKQQLLDVPSLLAVCAGRPGARRIRKLVEHGLPHTRSDLEAAFLDLCERYGLERPVMNAQLHGYEVDAYWPEHRLVVEIDSWLHHGTRAAFERDRARDADLHARGIATVRVTDEQITNRPGWVASRLARRSPGGSSSLRRSAA